MAALHDDRYQAEATRLMEEAFQKSPAELQRLVAEKENEYEYFYRIFYSYSALALSLEEAIAGMNKVYFELMTYRAVTLWRAQYLARVGKEFEMGNSYYKIPLDLNSITLRDKRTRYLSNFIYFPMFGYDPAPYLVAKTFPNISAAITDAIKEKEMAIAKNNPSAVFTAKNYEQSRKNAKKSLILGGVVALAGVIAFFTIMLGALDLPLYAAIAALWAGLVPGAAIAGYGMYLKSNAAINFLIALKQTEVAEVNEKDSVEKPKLISDLEKKLFLDIGVETLDAEKNAENA